MICYYVLHIYIHTHTYLSIHIEIVHRWTKKERKGVYIYIYIYIYIHIYRTRTIPLLYTTYILYIYIHIFYNSTHIEIDGRENNRFVEGKGKEYISNSNHTITRYYILHIYIYTYIHVSFTICGGERKVIYIELEL